MERTEEKNTSQIIIIFIAAAVLLMQVCGFVKKEQTNIRQGEGTASLLNDEQIEQQVEEILASMSIEQKIYQMFIVTPEALTDGVNVTTADETMCSMLKERPVGGLVYFSGNLINTEQTKEMLHCTQQYATDIEGMPLFLGVDEEGGKVARIGNNKGFDVPKIGAMGKIKSEEDAYEAGNVIGTYLSELGFNLDFAPDADVLTNQKNTVIGNRSFGSDAKTVLRYASAYADGLHNNSILSTFKHFPGHGATEADTHEGFAYTDKTYEILLQSELVPFAGAEEAGADFIMVSHISVPNITGDYTPCSLSYKMVTEILRGDLGYEGIIITDAMNMGAIVKKYTSDEAAVMAIQAGVDVILMPKDFKQAAEGVLAAVNSGTITKERIDESVRRILKVKLSHGKP
ncbi:MAG: glycoside hydrolase family 3 protein [Lachnospiraceae bacterium]|nr:glycoside hydrolase family 3 protein [Lachnospiraceae bacterium]